ncbi:hypothetical protein ACHAWF_006188 [Thalassiosira exigua]
MGCSQSTPAATSPEGVAASEGGGPSSSGGKAPQSKKQSSTKKSGSGVRPSSRGNSGSGGDGKVRPASPGDPSDPVEEAPQHPAALYHHLLGGLDPADGSSSSDGGTSGSGSGPAKAGTHRFWDAASALLASRPSLAAYVDPTTGGTPLHVACSLGSSRAGGGDDGAKAAASGVADAAAARAAASFAAALAEAGGAGVQDKRGHVPLEGIFAGMRGGGGAGGGAGSGGASSSSSSSSSSSHAFRMEAAGLLLDRAPRLLRDRGILYRIIESLPDDVASPLGPTVELAKVLVDRGGASAHPTPSADGGEGSDGGGRDDEGPGDDDVLALLYRRFVRQFDQSERFFAGDNSRPEVVDHRRNFKNAAVNTFNVIELLLRRPGGDGEEEDEEEGDEGDLLVRNAVRCGTCPPDLLRYVVETNLEAVARPDARGNLPLHYAAGYDDVRSNPADSTSSKSPKATKRKAPESFSKYVIDELLYAYPEGAAVKNADGVLPIVLAIESGKKWIGGGVRSLHEAYPKGIEEAQLGRDHPLTGAASFLSQDADADDVDPEGDDDGEDGNGAAAAPGGDGEGTVGAGVDGSGGRRRKRKHRRRRKINRDERHDAIMFVQRPGAPHRDVASTMWAHEEDGGVQMLGCTALERAATDACSQGGREAVASVALLGAATVVNAMKNHPNEPAVQEKACAALAAMSPADGRREVSFAASGAVATAVAAMQAHVGDATVQREACRALRGITTAEGGGAERATVVASVSGFTALVNAMGAHPEDGGVQREACAALEALTGFPDAYLPELHEQTEALLGVAAERFPEECSEMAETIRSRLGRAER